MQLSLHADYSCRVLIYLATKNQRCTIEEIADSFDVSNNHLVKVVHQLGKLGYLETIRGRGGGIQLARAPKEISIGSVIRATELTLDIAECFNSDTNTCPIIANCGLKPYLAKAMKAFWKSLDDVTLDDIVKNKKGLSSTLKIVNE